MEYEIVKNQYSQIILTGILLSVIIFGIVLIPAVDAATGKLTIRGESSTIYFNESVYYKGKLTDSEGYAISFERINLWEFVNGEWKYITQGKTDARGEYKITVKANYWNYAKSVKIIANSASSIQSSTMTLNIEKPYGYQIKPEIKNNISRSVSTNLFLQISVEPINNSIELNPILTTMDGNKINSNSIKVYVNGETLGTIPANKWSGIGIYESVFLLFNAKFEGQTIGTITYQSSSGEASIGFKNLDSSSDTKSNQSTRYSTSKSSITTTNDNSYKDPSYKIKSKYYAALKELESGVKLSESSLSGIVFENSDAKKKLDFAWKLRYDAWSYIDEGKDILKQAELYLKNQNYQKAWEKMHQFDKEITSGKNHVYTISLKIKEGKELEDKYQEKNKSCFLFWCNTKDTTKGLDLKIKDLELSVQKIKNKQKDITLLYQSGVQNQKLIKQKDESIQIQQRLEEQNMQTEIRAMQEQQKLEEDKQRELNNQRILAEQEQQRLEEQKQRELREQQYQAQLEQQRLEEQNRIDAEKNQIRLDAKNVPLVKGWMKGELTYYVNKLPSYTSQNVRNNVENLASWMDGKYLNGVKMKRSYSGGDITINWVKDYQEGAIGRMVGSHLIVGLGSSSCGDWKPFDATTVYRIMYHEMGHAMGQAHNSDFNNIMYEHGTGNKYEYDYSETVSVSDGQIIGIPFCHGGEVSFSTEIAYSSSASYKVYVVPPNSNFRDIVSLKIPFYLDCSGYENNFYSFPNNCNVDHGSWLLLYNPSNFGTGKDAQITVKIIDQNPSKDMDYTFKSDSRFSGLTDDYLYRVKELFR